MWFFHLAKQGYGSYKELLELDTKEFLDMVEYEQISQSIESYHIEKSKKDNS